MTISTKEAQRPSSYLRQVELERVKDELDNLKKQSERLDLKNKLHARLAGVLSLSAMIETYSVWLMPLVNHELIGYNNSHRKMRHLLCSGHGPNRRKVLAFAEQLINNSSSFRGSFTQKYGCLGYKWIFETAEDAGVFLIIKKGHALSEEHIDLVTDSLDILAESLGRGLEYEELFEKATNDALTGLSNRRVFEERVHSMVSSAQRYNHPLSMISMDLDKFKNINDNLGHHAGDQALKAVAAVFKKAVRNSDLLVRMGGDEFLIILDQTDLANARALAERLCKAVSDLNIWADAKIKLGVSIGLSQVKSDESVREWLERTDDLLYHAKAEGRSRVAVA
jgi:diguanylate cyclase (GGDEF)-like protein